MTRNRFVSTWPAALGGGCTLIGLCPSTSAAIRAMAWSRSCRGVLVPHERSLAISSVRVPIGVWCAQQDDGDLLVVVGKFVDVEFEVSMHTCSCEVDVDLAGRLAHDKRET